MNCRNAKANFSSYIEQELSEIERRGVAAHLGRCPRCSSDLFAMQKAMSLLRWVARVEGSPDFTDRLLERIHAEKRPEPAAPAWLGPLVEDWRRTCRDFGAMLAAPAPVGALLAALLLGGGGGAFLVGTLRTQAVTSPAPVVQTPDASSVASELVDAATSTPPAVEAASVTTPVGASPAGTSPAGTSVMASAPPTVMASAPSTVAKSASASDRKAEPRPATVRSRRTASPAEAEKGVEVAAWSTGGKRLDGLPEGPPPISRVEYVLDRVDVNGRPIEAVPAGLLVQEGSVTF